MSNLLKIQPPFYNIDDPIIPAVRSIKLDNNIQVFLIESGNEEITRIDFNFKAGQVKEYLPLLASTTNLMLTEGSEKYTAIELKRLLDYYGSFINLYCEKDSAGFVVYSLNKHIEKIIQLTTEILLKPLFPEAELRALMKKRLSWFRVNREKVQNLAIDQFFESVFGSNHPYGRKIIEDDFRNITSDVLKDFYRKYYTHANLTIIIAGRVPDQLLPLLNESFGGFISPEIDIEDPGNIMKSSKKKKIQIPHTGAVQSAIRIGSSTINKRHSDYPGLKFLDAIIGGYFGSRLMKNIREDKGLTYGIGSSVTSFDLSGYKVISTEVAIESTRLAIDEIYREIELLHRVPVGKEELAVVRNFLLGDIIRMFDGPFACANSFRSVWEFGLDYTYYQRLSGKIKTIDPDEIISLASTYYKLEDLYEITAGSL